MTRRWCLKVNKQANKQQSSMTISSHIILSAHTVLYNFTLPSVSPVVSLSLCIWHEWMRTQMLAKPSLNLLQRTGGDHRGGRAQLGWRAFMMMCLQWIMRYVRLEIWCKIGLSGDWCLCTALYTLSGACYYWIGYHLYYISNYYQILHMAALKTAFSNNPLIMCTTKHPFYGHYTGQPALARTSS